MERLENVATPATAATVVVPDSVPPPGLVPMATVMIALELGTVLPNASCTSTRTAGLIAAPAVALLGQAVNASRLAAAGTTVCCCGAGLPTPPEVVRLTNGAPAWVSL